MESVVPSVATYDGLLVRRAHLYDGLEVRRSAPSMAFNQPGESPGLGNVTAQYPKVVSDFETPPKSANTQRFTLLNENRACELTL